MILELNTEHRKIVFCSKHKGCQKKHYLMQIQHFIRNVKQSELRSYTYNNWKLINIRKCIKDSNYKNNMCENTIKKIQRNLP